MLLKKDYPKKKKCGKFTLTNNQLQATDRHLEDLNSNFFLKVFFSDLFINWNLN
jgi:hypothetical protein